ncbi:MAG: D-glycero-beta-D-manno-heptose-7-phosphate kinase [Candidatus Omnitrophica bacterium]|nr:D-glycero-beta-D-manno-heptose-7-phosphate kinase [Candidatus Omnitrophota bacterium]
MHNLRKIIQKFPRVNILVAGDLILDDYIWGKVDRISPEAPVPVLWADKRTYAPGGAANVANNISAFKAKVTVLGVVGGDKNKDILLSELKKRRISADGIFVEPARHTTVKTRIVAGHQQVVRVDWEHTHSLSQKLNQQILNFARKNIRRFDAVIIEDYGKGVINEHLLKELIGLARSQKRIITVDPKEEHFQYYHGVTSITPNRRELENAIRNLKIKDTANRFRLNADRLFTDKDIDLAAAEIIKYLDLDSLLVTLGEDGMRLFERGGRLTHIPTVAQEVFDVSGAGDTVVACFTLALASGATKLQAAHIANFAAGIVVGKLGTAVTNKEELLRRMD